MPGDSNTFLNTPEKNPKIDGWKMLLLKFNVIKGVFLEGLFLIAFFQAKECALRFGSFTYFLFVECSKSFQLEISSTQNWYILGLYLTQ